MGDAHLQIRGSDETGPEDGHNVAGGEGAIADELGAEPKGLDEHGHGGELGETGCDSPESVQSADDGGEGAEGDLEGGEGLGLGVERFYGRDGGEGAVEGGCGGCEEGALGGE